VTRENAVLRDLAENICASTVHGTEDSVNGRLVETSLVIWLSQSIGPLYEQQQYALRCMKQNCLYVIGKLMGFLSLTSNLSWRVILASNRQESLVG
jgi:hypothetical protein